MKISPSIKDSLELTFSSLARDKNLRGERILSLGLGEPSFDTPNEIIEAAYKAMLDGYTRYSSPLGLIELRERVAENLLTTKGITAQPDEVMITSGAKMALTLVLSVLLQPGDEIVNITPCYPSYIPQILLAEPSITIRNVDVSKTDFSLDYSQVLNSINSRTKVLLLNFPNNPTGMILNQTDLRSLEQIMTSHPDLWLISDEIYDGLCFSGRPSLSPGSVSSINKNVVTISGFSKTYGMTGWRIGYLHCSKSLMGTISKLQQHINTNVPTFVQKAAVAALSMDRGFLDDYKKLLKSNQEYLSSTLAPSPHLKVHTSHGGLFSFINIENTHLSSDEYSTALLQKSSVAVTPGIYFGDNWDDHIRVSLACDSIQFCQAVDCINEFLI